MNHSIEETPLNDVSYETDAREAPEENPAEGRRAYSLNIPRNPNFRHSCPPLNGTFHSSQSLNNGPSIENLVPKRDPLTVLYSVTDGVLIITAIIFIVALGFVAVIVVMALIKVYFLKDKLDSIWADDWFWPG